MAYNKTTWENAPSTNTPINANNLNKIEEGIYQNSLKADQVGDLSNLKTSIKTDLVSSINELKEGEEYSTTDEIKTNKIVNGKPVYRKYYKITTLPTSGIVVSFSSDLHIEDVWLDYTMSRQKFGSNYLNLNFYYASNDWTRYYYSTTGIYVHRGSNVVNYSFTEFYVEYTKTTD
jgi:hypothetical protein